MTQTIFLWHKMKRVDKPNTLLLWNGELVRVGGISRGKTIHMTPVGKEGRCETCGGVNEISVLEDSPLFQNNAEPVDTLIVAGER